MMKKLCGILILILLCQYCFAVNVTVWIGTLNKDLPCGGGSPYFTWKKKVGDTYHQIYDNEKYYDSNKYWLRINNIECSDAGIYRCESNKPTPEEPIYLQVKTENLWFCWSEWTSCSERCTKTRSRTCSTSSCVGPDVDTINCCSDTPFVDILKDYYVTKTNQTITIDVVIRNANSASLLWIKDGRNISVWSDARYTGGNIDRPSLVIKNVQINDKGEYKCQVQSSTFGSNEDSTTLKVVHTTANETEYITKINETVTLNCDKQDAVEVNWFHDKIKIVEEMDRYTGGVFDTPSLTIRSLTHKDRGIYTCETSYDGVKSRTGAITLNILDKPFFESSQEYVHVTAGGDVMLPCTFYSYSDVKEVLWHKDGERFNLNAIKYNGSTTDQPSLTIYNLGIADSGRYSCFVTNDQGKSSSNIIELQITDGEKSSNVTSAVLGTFGGVLVIIVFIIIGLLIKKKR